MKVNICIDALSSREKTALRPDRFMVNARTSHLANPRSRGCRIRPHKLRLDKPAAIGEEAVRMMKQTIENPKSPILYLAPLQGTTDRIYRNLFPLYFKGVDLAIAPFISATKKVKPDNSLLRDFARERNTGLPTIPQIMGSNPEDFTMLANRLFDIGYDTVNWNLGCPFPMVVRKGRGSGMLCYPDQIDSFLERTMPVLKPKLSIKLRLGLKHSDDVLGLMPIFNTYAIEELIIHPRTGVQMYDGSVDLDRFDQCLQLAVHRIVYNGDIDSSEKLAALSRRFGSVDRWMIGRGLIGNPFLAEEIKSPVRKPAGEKRKIMKAFHDHLFAEYSKMLSGPAHITNKMKEVWTYMAAFFEASDKVRKKINKTHQRDHYVETVNEIFNETRISGTQ